MNVPSWIYDPWFISLATIVITLIIEPLLRSLLESARSLSGYFTGTYLELTMEPGVDSAVVDIVKCQHIGNRIRGRIEGVAFVELKDDKLIVLSKNNGRYKLNGSIDERLLVLSYYTTNRRAKGSGTLTLEADSSGRIFKGIWAGLDEGQVSSSTCIWIRIRKKQSSNHSIILEEAKKILRIEKYLRNNLQDNTTNTKKIIPFVGRETDIQTLSSILRSQGELNFLDIEGSGGIGKTGLLKSFSKLKDDPIRQKLLESNSTPLGVEETRKSRPQISQKNQRKTRKSRRYRK